LQLKCAQKAKNFEHCHVVPLKEHHGFTYAVKAALEHVKTLYVMVVQHDRDF
jgi:hypothetical protein